MTTDSSCSKAKPNVLFQQATIIELYTSADFAKKIAVEGVFKPDISTRLRGEATDKEFVAKKATQLNARLDVYERFLSKRRYLGGETITRTDLFHILYGALLPVAGVHLLEVESRPNIAKYVAMDVDEYKI
ncbi:hypothetical protein CVT25_003692 [Psilocybe cyanescens]|uniref:Glutathione S-transferase C-terminal domain-containing protein n=1 Tax=Psilocybe cyanescens TaxID=93625 RepID=A0A409WP55_PSICY|nr:hypothetical protein CVT25_003692 [Psilocybe cyanescens]